MHTMPRLSNTRSYPRRSPILHNTLPPFFGLRCRIGSSSAGKGLTASRKEEVRDSYAWRELYCIRRRSQKVPVDVDLDRMGTWFQCFLVPTHNIRGGVLLHSPSPDRNIMRSSCRYRVVENSLLRFHQSRSSTRISASFETGRRCTTRDIQSMPVSAKHHTRQPDILLVGPNFGLSARVSKDEEYQMGICG